MPHYRIRYTRRIPDAIPIGQPINRTAFSAPLPQTMEIVCAENEQHARAMLGFADPNLPVFVSATRSPVTINRYCACQRIS